MKTDNYSCDLLIVGAGIVGACSAFLCTQKRPDLRICILDQSFPGSGATAYSAGLATLRGETPEKRALAIRSRQIYRNMERFLNTKIDHPQKCFWVVSNDDLARFEDEWDVPPEKINETKFFRDRFIDIDEATVYEDSSTCRGEPRSIVDALLSRLSRYHNVDVVECARVEKLIPCVGNISVRGDDFCIESKSVMIAAGPWASEDKFACHFPSATHFTKRVVALRLPLVSNSDSPCIYLYSDGAFLLPSFGTHLLSVSSQIVNQIPTQDSVEVTSEDRQLALPALQRCPHLANNTLGGRVFWDNYKTDRTPSTLLTEHGTMAMVVGMSGSGYRLAPAVAEDALDTLGILEC